MAEQTACLASDLKEGSSLRIDLESSDGTKVPIAVVRTTDGRHFAVDDTCSHGRVSLSEGEVDGGQIECWGHGARFDLETGAAASLPAITPIHTYPVRIDGGTVLVDVDAPTNPKEDA